MFYPKVSNIVNSATKWTSVRPLHRCLVSKLHMYGIDGSILQWYKAFLFNRQQQVLCDGIKSLPTSVTSSIPQGTVLDPLLFLMQSCT